MRPSRQGTSSHRRPRRLLVPLVLIAMTVVVMLLHAHMIASFEIRTTLVPLFRSGAGTRHQETTRQGGQIQPPTTTMTTTSTTSDPLFPPPPPLANDPNAQVYVSTSSKPRRPRTRRATTTTRRPHSPFGNDRDDAEADEQAARDAYEGEHQQDNTPPTTETTSDVAVDFLSALDAFEENLVRVDVGGNPDQPSHSFVDIDADVGRGVALPYDPEFVEEASRWQACDPRNVSFSRERDALCQSYLSNTNNMRFIKAMPSKLLQGRTIKMKVYYAHNNIQAIVKLPQRKFVFEAASEFFAYAFDRTLQFNRVPTTVYSPIPLDYLRAASAYSPLLSQWFHRFVVLYKHTNEKLTSCTYYAPPDTPDGFLEERCTDASIQLWMKDVHPALDTFLGLAYEYTEGFARKYYVPGHELWEGTKKTRLRAVGELLDRFIFDFLIGNTDRGMNDHNNFVYGGCSARTECAVLPPSERVLSLAKYAYLDHGSSLYSHKEPEGNPFFGQADRIPICRFRRSTYTHLLPWRSHTYSHYPLIREVERLAPTSLYRVTEPSVVRRVQGRLDKVLGIIESCLEKYPESVVFSMPEYNAVRIHDEDLTLDELEIDLDAVVEDAHSVAPTQGLQRGVPEANGNDAATDVEESEASEQEEDYEEGEDEGEEEGEEESEEGEEGEEDQDSAEVV